METVCTYKLGQWQCSLTPKTGSNLCCLHDAGLHEKSDIIRSLHQLSQTEDPHLLAYELRDFETPKNPAIRFKNKYFKQGLWSAIKWNNDFFTRCDFLNLEWENVMMEACVLEEFQFKSCKFYGYNDSRSNWLRGSFESIKSTSQDFRLEELKIENCLFSDCNWESLNFYNCVLREVYFADCIFEQASFLHCDFVNCRFEGNSGILAMENCRIEACQMNEPEEQLLVSKVNCTTKG